MQYYNAPPAMGMGGGHMDPRMMQMQQMQNMQNMQGMGGGMMGQPGMMGGMGMGGQAYRQLGYDYTLPTLGYKPDASWGAWDLANAQYTGSRMERGFFDNVMTRLTEFFQARHLSEDAARDAHRRVYYQGEAGEAGNKTLGGAAAYQAYLIWDRDHYTAYHMNPSSENRERLIGLALGELYTLLDKYTRNPRVSEEESTQYAAATAKYLFDRHYDLPHHHGRNRSSRHSGYGADGESDGEDDPRMRRRSMYAQQPYGMGGMQNPMMGGGAGMGMGMQQPGMMGSGGGGMIGPHGMGMPGMGMAQPGMGAIGMPGSMQNGMMGPGGYGMGGMGSMGGLGNMGGMGGMGMHGGYGGMGGGMMGGMGGMGYGGGMSAMGGNPMAEAQAAPGMHPYHYGTQSGVAYGNQPIDQMGNPTYPGGPGRTWYGYGQPRNY